MDSLRWMIYGANGFSGSLIAREAVRQNLKPILAGRNLNAISALAKELNLDYKIFNVTDGDQLEGIELLLNCAGPFNNTAKILAQSCVKFGVHYLDISGEISTFQQLLDLSSLAQEKRCILLPGAGFFVTATDALLSLLTSEMIDANSVDIFFVVDSQFRFNRGSLKSMSNIFYELHKNITVQSNSYSFFLTHQKVEIDNQKIVAISFVLPDLVTGKISSKVKDIVIYGHFRTLSLLFDKAHVLISNKYLVSAIFFLLPKKVLNKLIELIPISKIDIQSTKSGVLLHGIAKNKDGFILRKTIEIDNPYIFTQYSSLILIKYILYQKSLSKFGFQTPSLIFGSDLLNEVLNDIKARRKK